MLCTDDIRGIIPAGDTRFLLRGSSQPQFFNWEKYGISLSAPKGILPQSETCVVAITALAGGEFEFPEGSVLVSAVYVISISKPLQEPLTINMQHCVALETPKQCNSLHFVRAQLNNGTPPYIFEALQIQGGYFTPGSQYGSISSTEFSLFGILWQEDEGGEDSTSDEEDGSSQENEDPSSSEDSETDSNVSQIPNETSLQLYGGIIYSYSYASVCMYDYLYIYRIRKTGK